MYDIIKDLKYDDKLLLFEYLKKFYELKLGICNYYLYPLINYKVITTSDKRLNNIEVPSEIKNGVVIEWTTLVHVYIGNVIIREVR